MSKPISLYSTKTQKKEKLVPINPPYVSVYTCGPTLYHTAHIGNMRAYVFADTLRRTLTALGYKPKYIINFTDVGHLVGDGDMGEDKVEQAAKKRVNICRGDSTNVR